MSFLSSHIVYIMRVRNGYVTGLTSDIDQAVNNFKSNYKEITLVFQKHFDDLHQAKDFELEISSWNDARKEALIRGES